MSRRWDADAILRQFVVIELLLGSTVICFEPALGRTELAADNSSCRVQVCLTRLEDFVARARGKHTNNRARARVQPF